MTHFTDQIIEKYQSVRDFLEQRSISKNEVELATEQLILSMDHEAMDFLPTGERIFVIIAHGTEIRAYGPANGPLKTISERPI